jgi:hypothetical protein
VEERGRHRRGDGSRSAAAGRSWRSSARVRSSEESRSALAARLRERQAELEGAIATRFYSIADPREVADPAYPQGLHTALAAAVDFALTALERGGRGTAEIPPAVLAQARLAARDGVPLETVLRRCSAGNALLGDFLVEEAERAEVSAPGLRRLLGIQATLFDRLLASVSDEYAREARNRPGGATERRRECVKRLLAGELVDHSELGYDLDAHHLGLMAKGDGAEEVLRELARRLDRRLLAVKREEEPIWACWVGGRRPLAADEVMRALAALAPDDVVVTIGEPGEGLAGWRFSHAQAKAALPVAERRGETALRYADVALVASIVADDLTAASLRQLYLAPLAKARDGGEVARETLRAYFGAERNVSATAAALGVDRRTVRNRLSAIEDLLGRRLPDAATDLEIALRLDD